MIFEENGENFIVQMCLCIVRNRFYASSETALDRAFQNV